MLVFGLTKTQLWVTTALLLLLCFSICPHSGYPYNPDEEEDYLAAKENLDDDMDLDLVHDEDEDWAEEEDSDDGGATSAKSSSSSKNKFEVLETDCIKPEGRCGPESENKNLECCGQLECKSFKAGGVKHCLRKRST